MPEWKRPARNIGELRKRLAKIGDPWSPDAELLDSDPIPERGRGAQNDEEIPESERLSELDEGIDDHLRTEPPSNPYLRQRWIEEGLLEAELETDRNFSPEADAEWGPA